MPTKTKEFKPVVLKSEHIIVFRETHTSNTSPLVRCPPEDPTREQELKLIEEAGVLDFWGRPEEDEYTLDDGEPV